MFDCRLSKFWKQECGQIASNTCKNTSSAFLTSIEAELNEQELFWLRVRVSKVCIFRCIKRLSEGDARARTFEMIICGTFLFFNSVVADFCLLFRCYKIIYQIYEFFEEKICGDFYNKKT